MKCFEVTINGQKVCTAGIADYGVLNTILQRDFEVGDEIMIRIIEASQSDQPATEEVTYTNCSFCGKKQFEARTLIAGPTVYICDECVRDSKIALTSSEPTGSIAMILSKSAEATCSFCGQEPMEVDGIVGVPQAKICNQCIKICEEILAKDEGRLTPPESV